MEALVEKLPPHIQEPLRKREDLDELLELVFDLGREPEARLPNESLLLNSSEVMPEDIQYVIERIGSFGDDNRAGIERTLHRISAIRNRNAQVVGLTLRVGRAVYGTIRIIEDLIFMGKSLLLLGRPGVGKTTMLREVARVLADEAHKRVIVVDTSNEIAGDGDIPHHGIGHARRMQVPTPALQHSVMIEAVENHMPEVIIIDEIGTELDANASRTIAERGVQLVATGSRQHAGKPDYESYAIGPGGRHTVSYSRRHRGTPTPHAENGSGAQSAPNIRHRGGDTGVEPSSGSHRRRRNGGPNAERRSNQTRDPAPWTQMARFTTSIRNLQLTPLPALVAGHKALPEQRPGSQRERRRYR